jgi:hypothetical protein
VASLSDARLSIEPDPDRPNRRRVTVQFRVAFTPAEQAVRQVFAERVTLHSVPDEGASGHGRVHSLNLVLADDAVVADGPETERSVVASVPRHVLDVDEDWWQAAEDGTTQPVAEYVDRLVAEIDLVAYVPPPPLQGRTNTVSGSWGVLGND